MRLSLRFVIPLLVALAGFAYAALPLVDKLMLRWFSRDLEVRANLIALAFCPTDSSSAIATPTLPAEVRCSDLGDFEQQGLLQTAKGPVFVSVRRLNHTPSLDTLSTPGGSLAAPLGQLVLIHDMSFITRRSRETREYLFLFFVGIGLTVAIITVVIAQLSWRGWIQGMRALLRGERLVPIASGRGGRRGADGP